MRLMTEANGIVVEINSNRMLDLNGLTAFMQSLNGNTQAPQVAAPIVKRGRGRPAGAKNKGVKK